MDEWTDDRPEADPDMFMYRELPGKNCEYPWREMCDAMRERGAQEVRMTIVCPEYPNPPYPDGLYVEGWLIAPHKMEVPHKAAAFNYPLTATP